MAWRPWRVVSWVAVLALLVAVSVMVVDVPSARADAAVNQRLLELLNRERAANGLRPLVADARLSAAAEDAPYTDCGFPDVRRAKDMVDRRPVHRRGCGGAQRHRHRAHGGELVDGVPCRRVQPAAANMNYGPGQTVGNSVVAVLGADGQISLFNAAGTTHFIADVAGWFVEG